MAIPANNPLFKHFRQPSVYLQLPSHGKFWPEDSIDLPVNGQIPIYPMTVTDEITFKTPDALMNGEGVAKVIESCCPNIKNAWDVPLCDLDPILISIRMASYGAGMDITTQCTHCESQNENTVDLRILLDTLSPPLYTPQTIDGLSFQFKPQSFQSLNQANQIKFEQDKLIMSITDSTMTEEQKMGEFRKMFPNLTDMNIMAIVNCIESITTEDGTVVTDQKHIKEFMVNCETGLFNAIKKQIDVMVKANNIKPVHLACSECNKEYESELNFEQSSFFG